MTNVIKTTTYTPKFDEDFPGLGAMAPRKEKKRSSVKVKSSGKGRRLTFDELGFTTRMDKLKADRHSNRYSGRRSGGRSYRDPQRTAAYEKLQQREDMAEQLTKTRLCWSVEKGVPCPHGKDKCKFAHSLDELRTAPCVFGSCCRYVERAGDDCCYKTIGERVCHYLHPDESRESFMIRTGLNKVELKTPPTKVTTFVPSQVKINAWTRPRIKIALPEEGIKKDSEE